jgi:NADH-quinone oxidoreductase subunit H
LSQITIPWTARDPRVLSAYRLRAIRLLLGVGIALLVLGLAAFLLFDMHEAQRIRNWRIAVAYLGVAGPLAAGALLVAGGMAVAFYRQLGTILKARYVGFLILCGATVGTCLAVWAVQGLFVFVSGLATELSVEVTEAGTLGTAGVLTARDIYFELHGPCAVPITAYLLWPLQFEIVRDLLAMAAVVGFICIMASFAIWWERKVAGRIQSRLGPMRVGRWHGWAQSPADGIKLVLKEDLIPEQGDRLLFRLAPYVAFVPAVCAFVALPFAAAWVFRDLDVALIFILAMLGVEVIGVIIAGWASNNKWSVYGAMREACQMVSYEIPMGMSLLIPVMMAGSLKLSAIAQAQAGGFHHWFVFANPWCFVAFFTYFTAALASCKRAPFDMPEAESELVAGFLTEYSGFRWALFFFGEYASMFAVSALAVILFLGGWTSPLPESWVLWIEGLLLAVVPDAWPRIEALVSALVRGLLLAGPVLFILKAMGVLFLQLWLRWTLPRTRIDQVLYSCIQVILPLTMVVLLANTVWVLGISYDVGWLTIVDAVLHWVLVAIGLITAATIIGLALYGLMNRRRMVGYLAVDHLPGS